MLGRDVLAAGGRLDGPHRVQPVVVTGDHAVEHGLAGLAAGRGVVEHLVQDHLQTVGVQRADHCPELRHPGATVGVHRVGALGRRPVQRVVAPVVAVGVPDLGDAGLLLRRVRRERRQVARRRGLGRPVLLDRGDVEGRQQVNGGQTGVGEHLKVFAPGRALLGERQVRAPQRLRHRGVTDREVAHVQLVDGLVDRLDDGLPRALPLPRPRGSVVQVHQHGVRRVQRQGDRRGVGDLVDLDRIGRRRVDRHGEPVGGVLPVPRAADRP